jgi:hypothetical protein
MQSNKGRFKYVKDVCGQPMARGFYCHEKKPCIFHQSKKEGNLNFPKQPCYCPDENRFHLCTCGGKPLSTQEATEKVLTKYEKTFKDLAEHDRDVCTKHSKGDCVECFYTTSAEVPSKARLQAMYEQGRFDERMELRDAVEGLLLHEEKIDGMIERNSADSIYTNGRKSALSDVLALLANK